MPTPRLPLTKSFKCAGTLVAGVVLSCAVLPSTALAMASSELYSTEPHFYGRFEARIRHAPGDGVVSSFFLWKEGSSDANAYWNELDMEKVGANCEMHTNAYYGKPAAQHTQTNSMPANICADYHTYTFEWTPTSITWLVDGKEFRKETGATATAFAQNATGGMTMHFNLWPGNSSFGGDISKTTLPVHEYISWVQYSAYDNGNFGAPSRQEFDGTTIPTGWAVGDWTSPFNLSTHNPQNVSCVSGIAVMSLTADNATGNPGTPPVDSAAGGASGSGGSPSSGGSSGSGSGGTSGGNGGAQSSGGVTSSGGVASSGGKTGSAGAAGTSSSSGGATSSAGGAASTGGAVGTGGVANAGGANAQGGATTASKGGSSGSQAGSTGQAGNNATGGNTQAGSGGASAASGGSNATTTTSAGSNGGTSGSTSGSTTTSNKSGSSGGCSMAGAPHGAGVATFGLMLVGLAVAGFRRARRRSGARWTRLVTWLGLSAALLMAWTAPAAAKAYKGAEVYTVKSTLYGRVEVRMRMIKGSGLVSTFFTYKDGSEKAGATWEETDIEVLGKNNATTWQSNLITENPRKTSEQIYTVSSSLADDYHTYTLEWAPTYVAWYLDGTQVRKTEGGQAAELVNPEALRFNAWSSTSTGWVGALDDSALPAYQFVNWIKYYKYDNGQFTLDWTDDFNTFDATRWGKGNWTFDGNQVDFDPNNAVVQDGTLILAITKEGATGFSGTVPADNGTTTPGTVTTPTSKDSGGCTIARAGSSPSHGGLLTLLATGLAAVLVMGSRRKKRLHP